MNLEKKINLSFKEHLKIFKLSQKKIISNLPNIVNIIYSSLSKGHKLLWCGNGGSASDCMHLSAEFVGKFNKERISLNSISLCSDAPLITCIANDFGYENIFSRQIEGIAQKGDILVALSTSGESENIIRALKKAKNNKVYTIGFLGKGGGRAANYCDSKIIIPSISTPRIQEQHKLIGHVICQLIEIKLEL